MNLASRTPWTLSALALTGLCLAGNVDAQGLTARLAPETSTFRWNESIGLEDATLFGGGASLGFGRYVFLRASYKRASSVRTSLAAAGYGGPTVEENSVGASLFSTDVQIRLGAGPIAPVLVGGGGVLGLSPDARDDVRQIEASFGAGIDARLFSWLDGQLLLQDVRFRLDRSNIAGNALNAPEPDPDRDDLRRSLALTASLGARFGGGRSSARADRLDSDMGSAVSGGERLLIPVEVQAGVVRFDNALAIGDQPIAGMRAGLDFGPYFGLRGSYAGGLGRRSGMSTWSGEAQFNMGRVTTMSPHLLLGFGQLKFSGAFLDENGLLPEDKDALILGAGIGVPVGGRSRFVVSLRDYVTSPVAASVASTTADLRHNFSLSAGLSYLVRGRRRVGGPTGPALGPIPDAGTVAQAAPPNTVSAPPSSGGTPDAATTASQATAGGTPDIPETPSSGVAAAPGQPAEGQSATAAGSITYHSDRVVSIPIPTQGELYIRYGPSPAPNANAAATGPTVATPQLQTAGAAGAPTDSSVVLQLIREEVARSLAASSSGVTRADLEMLEVRIQNRLSASLEQLAQARPTDSSLSRQVEELTQLMRQRADEAPSQTLPIALISSEGSLALAKESRAPFLRGAAFRFGSASVRDSRTGIGASGDVMVGSLVSGRLRPYVSVQAGRAGVRGTLGSTVFPLVGTRTERGPRRRRRGGLRRHAFAGHCRRGAVRGLRDGPASLRRCFVEPLARRPLVVDQLPESSMGRFARWLVVPSWNALATAWSIGRRTSAVRKDGTSGADGLSFGL